LRAQQEELPGRIEEAERVIESESRQAAESHSALTEEERVVQTRVEQVRRRAEVYRRALAMDFVQSGQLLRVSLTCIDPRDPTRACWFNVQASEGGYLVAGCEPMVPELQTLLVELNARPNDFFRFVRAMRNAFKRLVAAEGGGFATSL